MHLFALPTGDADLDDALDAIEADLQAALRVTIGRLGDLLATGPSHTRVIHEHLATLHRVCGALDENRDRRDRRRADRHHNEAGQRDTPTDDTATATPTDDTATDDTATDDTATDDTATATPTDDTATDTDDAARKPNRWRR